MFVVSELARGGTLLDRIIKHGAFKESIAKMLFKQIAESVRYLHCIAGVVHRDIKCENILLIEAENEDVWEALDEKKKTNLETHNGKSSSGNDADDDDEIMNDGGSRKFNAEDEDDDDGMQLVTGSEVTRSRQLYSQAKSNSNLCLTNINGSFTPSKHNLPSQTPLPFPVAKLADFGLADLINNTPPPTSPDSLAESDPIFCMGSLHYCAPEELKRPSSGMSSGEEEATSRKKRLKASDVWSLGCVLYALLSGTLPFNDGFLPRLQSMIINGRYDMYKLESAGVSAEARNLVQSIFKVNYNERITIEQICNHSWLHDFNAI